MKEILDRDSQPVTQLLDRCDICTVVPSADDVIHSGLGDAAHITELVDGNIMLTA